MGNIARVQGQLADARDYYEQSLKLSQAIAEETGTVGSYDDYAVSLYKIAWVYEAPEKKQACLQKAYEIWKDLAEAYPDVPSFAQRRDIVKEYL